MRSQVLLLQEYAYPVQMMPVYRMGPHFVNVVAKKKKAVLSTCLVLPLFCTHDVII